MDKSYPSSNSSSSTTTAFTAPQSLVTSNNFAPNSFNQINNVIIQQQHNHISLPFVSKSPSESVHFDGGIALKTKKQKCSTTKTNEVISLRNPLQVYQTTLIQNPNISLIHTTNPFEKYFSSPGFFTPLASGLGNIVTSPLNNLLVSIPSHSVIANQNYPPAMLASNLTLTCQAEMLNWKSIFEIKNKSQGEVSSDNSTSKKSGNNTISPPNENFKEKLQTQHELDLDDEQPMRTVCERCTKRKTKCKRYSEISCERCRKEGIVCIYTRQRKRGRPLTSKNTKISSKELKSHSTSSSVEESNN